MHIIGHYVADLRRVEFCHLWQCGGTGGHYAVWNKLDTERQILYGLTYMWDLKETIS